MARMIGMISPWSRSEEAAVSAAVASLPPTSVVDSAPGASA